MQIRFGMAILAALLLPLSAGNAQEFAMVEVPSMAALSIDQLKPRSIVFNDYRKDELADPATGLIRFEDWARARPLQKQVLSLYPSYVEPMVTAKISGVAKAQ